MFQGKKLGEDLT